MSSHTQGPWTYEPSDDENSGMIWAKTGFIVEFNENPSEANARLIAAAPDLLEALLALSEWVDCQISDNECRPLENAKAAISKATSQ